MSQSNGRSSEKHSLHQVTWSVMDRVCTAHGPPITSMYTQHVQNRHERRMVKRGREKMGFATWTEAVRAARDSRVSRMN